MITIQDTLLVEDVLLDLRASTPEDAIKRTAALLRDDERVVDWSVFHAELLAKPPCRVEDEVDFGICIPHARSRAVSEMVMSAARVDGDLLFPDCVKPIRYIFCIGVPKALASDYLRIAGALMRIFKDVGAEAELKVARTQSEFVSVLARLERKL
jgi:PTS system nitrogen regulatory IIA component